MSNEITVSRIGNAGKRNEMPVYSVTVPGQTFTVIPAVSEASFIKERRMADGSYRRYSVKASHAITIWLSGIIEGWQAAKGTES